MPGAFFSLSFCFFFFHFRSLPGAFVYYFSLIMVSITFSRLAIFVGLCSSVIAVPLSHLEARANCADGKESPCVCGGALGLRLDSRNLRNKCGNQSFKFTNTASGTDGTVSLVSVSTLTFSNPFNLTRRTREILAICSVVSIPSPWLNIPNDFSGCLL